MFFFVYVCQGKAFCFCEQKDFPIDDQNVCGNNIVCVIKVFLNFHSCQANLLFISVFDNSCRVV